MDRILENRRFRARYDELASVSLNPRRHSIGDARTHSAAVAAHAARLAEANARSPEERALLEDLGYAHDIGKVEGTSRPQKSLEVLETCDVRDPQMLSLVRWHDTALPWWLSAQRGQAPSVRAWRRLASQVDVELLVLFKIADRVDALGGWRNNPPTVWFVEQARRRGLIGPLVLDLPGHPSSKSMGAALVHDRRVLVIRVRSNGWELPKGRPEWDESLSETALRELSEEAGVDGCFRVGPSVGSTTYVVEEGGDRYTKRVEYLRVDGDALELQPLPSRTRERRFVDANHVQTLPWIDDRLPSIALCALEPEAA